MQSVERDVDGRENGEDHFLGGLFDPQYPVIPKFHPWPSLQRLGKARQSVAEAPFIIVKGNRPRDGGSTVVIRTDSPAFWGECFPGPQL
jgi:hypothetical protein